MDTKKINKKWFDRVTDIFLKKISKIDFDKQVFDRDIDLFLEEIFGDKEFVKKLDKFQKISLIRLAIKSEDLIPFPSYNDSVRPQYDKYATLMFSQPLNSISPDDIKK